MKRNMIIVFLALMVVFALSCKKKRLNNDLCDCGNSGGEIKVNDTIYLIIPNVFSPNWDEYNDKWEIDGIEYFQDVSVTIYDEGLFDRTVFETDDYDEPWDGTCKGKQLKDGKYFYEISFGGQMHTGYVCIFTILDYEGEYRDCLIQCEPMNPGDPVFQ
jgi:gliding motility-associated-like protein